MALRPDFVFSQGSLQDYVECARRFGLRYVLRLAWPALEAEPAEAAERERQLGLAFHRLVHQHTLGISAEELLHSVADTELAHWWQGYLQSPPSDLPAARYPELVLAAPLGGYRLLAKYDLVAVEPGTRAVVLDWKTSRTRPQRRTLALRLQSKVYPYLLVRAGAALNAGQPVAAEQVEMVYWFADFPVEPERFRYDSAQCDADEAYLQALIERVSGLGEGEFPLTEHEVRCAFCQYRSLCERGVGAGAVGQAEEFTAFVDTVEVTFDFEQIAEIEF